MNWLLPNMCFLTISGSQAYGMNTETSDLDVKGIVLPPKSVRESLFQRFDQAINNNSVEEAYSHLRNPKNPKFESTIYSLQKFIQLAAQVNPNIIELLWADPGDVLLKSRVGEMLIENREMFLSTKAKFTFSGYAYAQFAKIERHRKWLIKGEIKKPARGDYGLPEDPLKGYGEIERIVKKDIEHWNFSKYSLDELERQELKETVWECVLSLVQNKITWDNWPEKYEQASLSKFLIDFNVSKEINDLIIAETKYKNDFREYQNWMRWKQQRNLDRKALEQNFLYDTKHGAHLIRLMRMGCEILESGSVLTKRPDAKELLAIRNGKLTYEQLKEEFDKLNARIDELYKTTSLRRSVNYEEINDLYYKLIEL